jgi:hypothetical protein
MPNDTRRPDTRKDLAEELAGRLAEGGARTARLLQLLGVVDAPAERAEPAGAGGAQNAPRPISIWEPRERDGEWVFERPEPLPLGDHYAVRRAIPAAKAAGGRRVALLGESAAAGYLLAPHLTPARAIEEHLSAAGGAAPGITSWQVIDLARTNESLAGLAATAEAALQLAPDAFVVWAGNNWDLLETPEVSPYAPSVEARQRFAVALDQAGWKGPVELARRRLAARAEAAFERIAVAAKTGGAAVTLVLPEVDLAGWAARQPAPWLPGEGSARWHALLAEAEAALDDSSPSDAEATARAMIDLDGGSTPTPHRLLARAALARGDLDAAAEAARAEVDAERYPLLCQLGAPRAGTVARELLIGAARRHGFGIVDLRAVLATPAGGAAARSELVAEAPAASSGGRSAELPGRRWFLDYCHLTRLGVRRAAAAIAAELLTAAGSVDQPAALAAVGPALPAAAEATALFGAAVHSAHRLAGPGKARVLEAWCRDALAASPSAAAAMVRLAAVRAAPCPAVLTAEQRDELAAPYPLGLQHGWRWDHLDADLLLAMRRALAAAGLHAEAAEIERRLIEGLAVTGPRWTELTSPPWLWEPLERFFPEAIAPAGRPGRATLRAPWPETGFALVTGGGADLDLEVTVRLPAIEGAPGERRGEATLRLDGGPVGSFTAGEGWTRHRLSLDAGRLPHGRLAAGLHRLAIAWPPLPPWGDAARAAILRRLQEGIEADLHPVFGEVASLRVRAAE